MSVDSPLGEGLASAARLVTRGVPNHHPRLEPTRLEPKLSQSVANLSKWWKVSESVAKLSRSRRKRSCRKVCRKAVAKLTQSCHRAVAKFIAKFVANMSQDLHKFMSFCCQSPFPWAWGEASFSVLPTLGDNVRHRHSFIQVLVWACGPCPTHLPAMKQWRLRMLFDLAMLTTNPGMPTTHMSSCRSLLERLTLSSITETNTWEPDDWVQTKSKGYQHKPEWTAKALER